MDGAALGNEIRRAAAYPPRPASASDEGIDAIVTRAVPGVQKAVKWNSPFYGIEAPVWFLSFHCFARYVKVTFFRGASLDPAPPVASKQKDVRYLDIGEGDDIDETQLAAWLRQAAALPGWMGPRS